MEPQHNPGAPMPAHALYPVAHPPSRLKSSLAGNVSLLSNGDVCSRKDASTKAAKLLGEAQAAAMKRSRMETREFRMLIVCEAVRGMWRGRLPAIQLIDVHSNSWDCLGGQTVG